MRIVPAAFEDLEEVLAMEREAVEAPHWALAEYKRIVGGGDEAVRRCLLVAWRGAERVGFVAGKVVAGVVAGEAELESVAVCASARRGGVGRALCQAAIAWAWQQRANRMTLEVRASSAGAMTLYRDLGFVEVGRRKNYYAEPVEDAVLMTLDRGTSL